MSKRRMTLAALRDLQHIQDALNSFMDGKRHGEFQCTNPIGENIYLKSWVMPKLIELIEHGEGRGRDQYGYATRSAHKIGGKQ